MKRVALSPTLDFSRIVYGMWRLAEDADTSPAHVRAPAPGVTARYPFHCCARARRRASPRIAAACVRVRARVARGGGAFARARVG